MSFAAQPFDQSFVPHCQVIQAVELGVYPASFDPGWVRLDVCEDDSGRPSQTILSRCWIRFDKDCPVGQWTPFALPDLAVVPDRKYWLRFTEFPEGDRRAIVNYRLSSLGQYAEGELLRQGSEAPSDREDAQFRIVSKCDPVPGLRAAGEAEKKTLPDSGTRGQPSD